MAQHHSIVSIVGTRPELQRVIPVLHELKRRIKNPAVLYIPQKHDPDALEMLEKSGVTYYSFPKLFATKKPGSIDVIIQKVQQRFTELQTKVLLVSGDTTIAVSGCLAAQQLRIPIAKIGAGFRLGDFNAPEEKNDLLTDHLAAVLFPFSAQSKQNLLNEGIPERKIISAGSTLIWHIHETLRNQFVRRDTPGEVLISLHRSENLESKEVMQGIFHTFTKHKIHATCIVHQPLLKTKAPRSKFITMHQSPSSYQTFITRLAQAKYIITDSNTIAEEACFLKVPCILVAKGSTRPETVSVGACRLINPTTTKKVFQEELENAIYVSNRSKRNWIFPYGDIKMTTYIANCIADTITGN